MRTQGEAPALVKAAPSLFEAGELAYGVAMDTLSIIVALLVGLAIGVIIGWLMKSVKGKEASSEARAEVQKRLEAQAAEVARLELQAERSAELKAELERQSSSAQEAHKRVVQLESELASAAERLSDHKAQVAQRDEERRHEQERREQERKEGEADKSEARERMLAQFKAAAHEIVEERTKAFDEKSQKSIGELVKPLKEQLEGFRKQLSESEKSASKERVSLTEQIKNLKELNAQIGDEARSLTRALKGESKTRGNWGEMVLARVLELSGLSEGREFETEVSETDSEGKRKRPDVIVHLPDDRQVVIDAKVTLVHYDAYCDAESDETRSAAMKQHIASIRGHVRGLSSKNYQHLESIKTLDYVLMFMPIEAAFTEAMRTERDIFEDAISRRVLIVTPSTLLAVLKTVETIWRHERQTTNVLEIARQAGALYDKFVGFSASLEKVGARLQQAQQSYDMAFSQLTHGKGNLVGRVKRLEKLGAKTSKKLPEALLEASAQGEATEPVTDVIDLLPEDTSNPQ